MAYHAPDESSDILTPLYRLGPTDLTEDTTSNGGTIPTFLDNAFAKGLVWEKTIGISFEPAISNGEITIGGTDRSKFIGELDFV